MKKIVVLSGAGMSAESGIKTFRDSDGLWENYRIEDVCTPEAWERNPELVNNFYNERRRQLYEARPNKGHYGIALHFHGELKKVRSSASPDLIYDLEGWELKLGEKAEDGSLLRPHIVWFGEAVPNISKAGEIIGRTDILVIIGTSLAVYPAAGLINYAPAGSAIYLIDPRIPSVAKGRGIRLIEKKASEGVEILKRELFL